MPDTTISDWETWQIGSEKEIFKFLQHFYSFLLSCWILVIFTQNKLYLFCSCQKQQTAMIYKPYVTLNVNVYSRVKIFNDQLNKLHLTLRKHSRRDDAACSRLKVEFCSILVWLQLLRSLKISITSHCSILLWGGGDCFSLYSHAKAHTAAQCGSALSC